MLFLLLEDVIGFTLSLQPFMRKPGTKGPAPDEITATVLSALEYAAQAIDADPQIATTAVKALGYLGQQYWWSLQCDMTGVAFLCPIYNGYKRLVGHQRIPIPLVPLSHRTVQEGSCM